MFHALIEAVRDYDTVLAEPTPPAVMLEIFCRTYCTPTPPAWVDTAPQQDHLLIPRFDAAKMHIFQDRFVCLHFPLLLPTAVADAMLAYNYRRFGHMYQSLLKNYLEIYQKETMSDDETIAGLILLRMLRAVVEQLGDPACLLQTSRAHLAEILYRADQKIAPVYKAGAFAQDRDRFYAPMEAIDALQDAAKQTGLLYRTQIVRNGYFFNNRQYFLDIRNPHL